MTRSARATLAGLLAVAAGLAATELANLLDPTAPSLLIGVQVWFIDQFGASLKDLAVQLFGTQDKTALEVGAFLVAMAFGPLVARLEVRRQGLGAAVIGVFALLGVLATVGHPQSSAAPTVVAGLLGGVVGIVTLWVLLDRFGLRVAPFAGVVFPDRREPGGAGPYEGEPAVAGVGSVSGTRREVMLWGLGAGAAVATAGALAKGAGDAVRRSRSVIPSSIPAPATPASLPPAPPFETAGLSPYIVPSDDFYLIDVSPQPPYVVTDDWTLRITGLVDREVSFTYADLLARDLVEEVVTLSCVSNEVGGDLVGNARWTGIPLRELLAEAGVQPSATQLVGESVDGFTAGFPVSALDDDRTALVAIGMNGQPLPRAHGFPARLVVSGLYGYVSATKWLSEIRLTTLEDEDGYWISRGWAKEAPVKTQSRIDVPRNRTGVAAGRVPIAGVAWAPSRGVSKVEVRIDEGEWIEADLGRVASDDTWVQWHVAWDAEPGDHEIQVRATDGDGETQGEDRVAPIPDGAEGWHTRTVKVAEA